MESTDEQSEAPETEAEAKHDCRTQLFLYLLQSKSALWLPAHLDMLSFLFTSLAFECSLYPKSAPYSAKSSEITLKKSQMTF